jgi:hypothetical protein
VRVSLGIEKAVFDAGDRRYHRRLCRKTGDTIAGFFWAGGETAGIAGIK